MEKNNNFEVGFENGETDNIKKGRVSELHKY